MLAVLTFNVTGVNMACYGDGVAPRPKKASTRKDAASIEKQDGSYHHGNLRLALIQAAREIVASSGAETLSLRAVARRAKVSTAAPYRHFQSRNALLAALAEDGFHALSRAILEAVAQHPDDPLARLREAGVAYVCFAAANPTHYRVMNTPGLIDSTEEPAYTKAAADALGLLLRAIRDCQDAGLVVADDPAKLALAAWSSMHGLATLIGNGQVEVLGFDPNDVDALARYVAQLLVDGAVIERAG